MMPAYNLPPEFRALATLPERPRLLVVDDQIRAQIHAQAPESEIRSTAIAAGMHLMRDDGERLVREGITTAEEVMRVTRD